MILATMRSLVTTFISPLSWVMATGARCSGKPRHIPFACESPYDGLIGSGERNRFRTEDRRPKQSPRMAAQRHTRRIPAQTHPHLCGGRSSCCCRGPCVCFLLHTPCRRPLSRFTIKTTRATTSSRWIKAPPTCRLNPSNHRIRRTTRIVQSISAFSPRIAGTRDLTSVPGAPAHSKPNYCFASTACAFAPLTASRNECAAGVAVTLPIKTFRVETLRP